MTDEALYSKCLEDFEKGIYEQDLYNKALVLCHGVKEKTKYKYVELWVSKQSEQTKKIEPEVTINLNQYNRDLRLPKPNIGKVKLIEQECKYLEDKLVGVSTLAYTLKSGKFLESVLNNFGSDNMILFVPLFFGWNNDSDTGLFKSKMIRDICLSYFKKNLLFISTIDVLRDRYVSSLSINNIDSTDINDDQFNWLNSADNQGDKIVFWSVGVIFWCCTGGLMFVHFISIIAGATGIILGIVGIFIPPVGLVNALAWILTGYSLTYYF